jgi:NAD(P)-dependent dehydrogenase (short-subunit alcohol dehydrogenase family)
LVTGAGSGIGRAIAIALARAGHRVALVGRRRSALEETAARCTVRDRECIVVDVGSAPACRAMVERTVHRFGRLDVLVNNAGVGRLCTIAETTPEKLDEVYRVNALATAWAIHFAWPHFRRQHEAWSGSRATVVNISSMATIDPFPGFFAYAGSKAAMNLMAASAAKEGGAIGVRAFALAPGAVETPMLRAAFDVTAIPREQCLPPEAVAAVAMQCVLGERDGDNGRVIAVLPESGKAWFRQWVAEHPVTLA